MQGGPDFKTTGVGEKLIRIIVSAKPLHFPERTPFLHRDSFSLLGRETLGHSNLGTGKRRFLVLVLLYPLSYPGLCNGPSVAEA